MRIIDPNRENYKQALPKNECVFCIGDTEMECPSLFGKFWKVRVNRYPYMDGNVMIVPKRHVEKTSDLTAEEWAEFGQVLANTQESLEKAFNCKSFNIGLNLGPESGASIAHLHWQMIPRKITNLTVANIFADIYIVGTTPEETKKRLEPKE